MSYWNFFVFLFTDMPYLLLFIFGMVTCVLYVLVIGPICFNYWIIPKIENRYDVRFKFDSILYSYAASGSWSVAYIEVSLYIFCLYTNIPMPILENKNAVLNKINYDISTATKAEIIMSAMTIFSFISLIVLAIVELNWPKDFIG